MYEWGASEERGLTPIGPAVSQAAEERAADGSQYKDGNIRLGDDGIGESQEAPERQPRGPAGPGELSAADGEAVQERPEESGSLIGERHRQHHARRDAAEDQVANNSPNRCGHGHSLPR